MSKQFAPRIVKASGVVVIGLGAIMLNRGLAMTGQGHDFQSLTARWMRGEQAIPAPPRPEAVQVIRMAANREGFAPREFMLRKGVPVRWIIQGEALDYCNHRIVVPTLGLEFDVHPGENTIEFTPGQTGIVPWSCWMGMQQGVFLVHESVGATAPANPLAALHDHGPGGQGAHAGHEQADESHADAPGGHEHHAMHAQEETAPGGHEHGGHGAARPAGWMRNLLEKSAAAIESLRRNLKP